MEWQRFLEVFANPAIFRTYGPNIAAGAVVTLQVAAAVIVTGIALGLALASVRVYRIRALNLLIVGSARNSAVVPLHATRPFSMT